MMYLVFAYLIGVLTPVAALLLWMLKEQLHESRRARRYERAWAKFSAEFDRLEEQQLAFFRIMWAERPWEYQRFSSDRDRYFAMRWKYGNTTEV